MKDDDDDNYYYVFMITITVHCLSVPVWRINPSGLYNESQFDREKIIAAGFEALWEGMFRTFADGIVGW